MLQLRAERRAAAALRLVRVILLVDEMELERCRGAEHAFRRSWILDAGQLDQNAVEPLPLDHCLGDAELIDAVAQGHGVLLNREILALANRGLGELHDETGAAIDGPALDDEAARELAELQQLIAGVERANDLLGGI